MTGVCIRRNLAPGGGPDRRLRRITTMFGHPWPGEFRPTLYARNRREFSNDRDSLTGVVFPSSKLTEDDLGRTVNDLGANQGGDGWLS